MSSSDSRPATPLAEAAEADPAAVGARPDGPLPVPARSGFDLRLAAAAAAGGLIGIGGSLVLAIGGSWPDNSPAASLDRARVAGLETRLSEAEKRLAAPVPPAAAAVPADLARRLAALEQLAADRGKQVEALQKDLQGLRSAAPSGAPSGASSGTPVASGTAPGADPARLDELERKFLADIAVARGGFEQALTAQRQALAAEIKGVAGRTEALTARLDAGERAAAERLTAEIRGLADRVAAGDTALEAKVSGLAETLGRSARRLEALETAAGETAKRLTGYEDLKKTVDVLFARVAGFEETRRRIETISADMARLADLGKAVEANGTGLVEARRQVEALTVRSAEAERRAGDLDGRLGQIGKGLDAAAARTAAVEARFNGFSDRIGEIEGFARRGADARTDAVLALSLGALRAAVDDGRPFATELATARTLARGAVDLAVLEPLAATGVPTSAVLVDRYGAVAKRILQATAPAETGGLMDKLLANAGQAVSIRKVGEIGGDGPEARVARLEDRLKARDLAGALAEWRALPETGRKVSADWAAGLEARVAVDKALAASTASVLSKLVQPGQ
ncbi:hypothetical protein [Prosthecodimorpha staleyi]|uniref:Uncharacterized protein n=1 Tax=Prosthecodimorpha staleyi TaxID=2840188 RepID=A0A947D2H4_9HYPH|nr:hypothetical protein [Prosthecodimorpha staleyi]MBT9289570.1 hypothetical protein [Prosthecodimorpha staleyi]